METIRVFIETDADESTETDVFCFSLQEAFILDHRVACSFVLRKTPELSEDFTVNLGRLVTRMTQAARTIPDDVRAVYIAPGSLPLQEKKEEINLAFNIVSVFKGPRVIGLTFEAYGDVPPLFDPHVATIAAGLQRMRPIHGTNKSERAEVEVILTTIFKGMESAFDIFFGEETRMRLV